MAHVMSNPDRRNHLRRASVEELLEELKRNCVFNNEMTCTVLRNV